MTPATTFAGKRVALFGLGGSGLVTAQALVAGGAEVACWDDSAAAREKAVAAGLEVEDLAAADWSKFAALILTPGVPLTHPQPHWAAARANAAGVEIIGDIELFCRERAKIAPTAPFIAITGTNGKSTTTALIAHILRSAGHDVQMGGNIGTAILALEPPSEQRIHVIEVSSFQIDLAPSLAPTIGVLINLTPDHIDRHGTMERYAWVKGRLPLQARIAVVGDDDDWTRQQERQVFVRAHPRGGSSWLKISASHEVDVGCFARGTRIFERRKGIDEVELVDVAGISSLRGRHNVQNAVAAICAVRSLPEAIKWEYISAVGRRVVLGLPRKYADFPEHYSSVFKAQEKAQEDARAQYNNAVGLVSLEGIQQAVASFPGLAHRMEGVGKLGRALFINDSKATNADATEKALLSFDDIYWILGGKPKEGGIEPLAPLFPKIAKAYLIGTASSEFAHTLEGHVPHELCGTLDVAVSRAAADASASDRPQPVVLLSPACASYDQFANFEKRGDRFRELVRALPGIEPTGAQR